jgi:hypothetical protein
MAASILVASSPGGRQKRCLPRAKMRGQSKASSSSVVAYNQDALVDEEATWIMEEEYRGASKRKKKNKRGQAIELEHQKKYEYEGEDDDSGCWWENDPLDGSVDGSVSKTEDGRDDNITPIEEHPLRTDEWLVRIKVGGSPWSSSKENAMLFTESSYDDVLAKNDDLKVPKRGNLGKRKRVQRLKFSPSGFVWVVNDGSFRSGDVRTKIGRWKLDHTGLHWDVEVAVPPLPSKAVKARNASNGKLKQEEQEDDEIAQIAAASADLNAPDWGSFAAIAASGSKGSEKEVTGVEGWRTTTLHYRTEIHLNKFGERPRMFKGIITRDRYSVIGDRPDDTKKAASIFGFKNLPPRTMIFRPVVATFEAWGIGEDTVDLAYRERSPTSNAKR